MIHSDKKHYVVFGTLALLIVLLVVANLFLGSVNIPAAGSAAHFKRRRG